jgi:hypothetical protein
LIERESEREREREEEREKERGGNVEKRVCSDLQQHACICIHTE